MDDDDHATRSTPPKTPEEWRTIWQLLNRMSKAEATLADLWVIGRPIHAAMQNRKLLACIAGLLVLLFQGDISAIIGAYFGIGS